MEELNCIYDARKSFYGKAKVGTIRNGLALYSYGTHVASIKKKNGKTKYIYYGNYSQTTTRHQAEFFRQNGLNDQEIKELFKNGVLEK